jgi:hypothetical protein
MKPRFKFVRFSEQIVEPLLAPLFDDVARCEELLAQEDTQFARRAFVRASFAFIEGVLYWFKECTTEWLEPSLATTNTINISKFMLLQDELPRIGRNGELETEPNRAAFKSYCAFILRAAAEVRGLSPTQLFGVNGWNCMQQSLAVRHRITHPKEAHDLEIADEEIEAMSEAHRWLFDSIIDIFNAMKGPAIAPPQPGERAGAPQSGSPS